MVEDPFWFGDANHWSYPQPPHHHHHHKNQPEPGNTMEHSAISRYTNFNHTENSSSPPFFWIENYNFTYWLPNTPYTRSTEWISLSCEKAFSCHHAVVEVNEQIPRLESESNYRFS